jgi:hypothetical protein
MGVTFISLIIYVLFNDVIAQVKRAGAVGWGISLQACVTGSIPDEITESFYWLDPTHRTVPWGGLSL